MNPYSLMVFLATAEILGSVRVTAQPATPLPTGPPPLKVSKDAPLLIDEPSLAIPGRPKVALPRLICYDCHGNFREETLALTHAEKEITCVECHGESRAHASDEGNTTPPQVMYSRASIAVKCRECHPSHDAPASAVILRWQQRGLQKLKPTQLACTDCHGEHRMKVRTVRWNKNSGKLSANEPPPEE